MWSELRPRLSPTMHEAVRFDLSRIESIDGGAMALLVQAKWDLQPAGVRCEFVGGTGTVQAHRGRARPPSTPTTHVLWYGHCIVSSRK